MPNLRDHIEQEIENGNLDEEFTISQVTGLRPAGDDCFVNGVKYPKSSIREILANHSIGPGNREGESIKKGQEKLFNRLRRATYSIFEDDGLDEAERQEDYTDTYNAIIPPGKSKPKHKTFTKDQIAADFVDYLRNKPFRIKVNTKKGGVWSPKDGTVIGWNSRLNEYKWNKKSWQETSSKLEKFEQQIVSLKSKLNLGESKTLETEASSIYSGILKWGNPKGVKRNGSFVLERLNELWNGELTQVDSTLTKLYALAEPAEYIIYDSRVATAIITIAEDIYRYRSIDGKRIETVNLIFHDAYRNLGKYDGSGGTRPRGFRWSKWPNAYKSVNAQKDANDLCKRIVNVLNSNKEDGRSNWTMREVEAVLFMEGY